MVILEKNINSSLLVHEGFFSPVDKSTIVNLGKQGRSRDLATIFRQATAKPHSYLFIDYHQETEEGEGERIQANVLFENNDPISIHEGMRQAY